MASFFIVAFPWRSEARGLLVTATSSRAAWAFFALSPPSPVRLTRLFLLAGLHAYVVFSLAGLRSIIFRAGLLLFSTLLTAIRLLSLYCGSDAAQTEQDEDSRSGRFHGDLPSKVPTASLRCQVAQARPDALDSNSLLLSSSRAPSCRSRRVVPSRASRHHRLPRNAGRTAAAARRAYGCGPPSPRSRSSAVLGSPD